MIYVTSALLAEASFLIETYQLVKTDDKHFAIYENDEIKLTISGIGKINAASATTYLLQKYHANKEDTIFNIGTCTSTKSAIMIGDIFKIKKLIDLASENVYHIASEGEALTCVDKALDSKQKIKTPLADMESVGFYLAAKRFIKKEHIMIVKVVSDKTDASIPESEEITSLFSPHIKTIGDYLS